MIAEHHPHSDAKVLHNWILEQNYELLFTQYLKSGKSEEPYRKDKNYYKTCSFISYILY